MEGTYLSSRGYTIPKKSLTESKLADIRSDLLIRPFQLNNTPGATGCQFPVYRESPNKIYVPHYYGVKEFGEPKQSRISQGENIDIYFQGELRSFQQNIVQAYIEHVSIQNDTNSSNGGLIELPCGQGKTVIGLNILSVLKKKTLIIVNKEDLMRQWIERIEQFLPNARVGKIQGQMIDIDDKDIVIGMLQSLSMKEYPESVFQSFGLTIIDEVHHISSQTFSNALFKIVTKYMLGLSATMNRKDGTSYVFKMFLGDVIYKGKREDKFHVCVRAIEYSVHDEEFNEIITDYRGKVQYSSMISKLCQYNRRTEFILRVLTDMITENPKQQIMILAHNKNMLKYMHDAIKHRNIGSVGYYVGGMKESALKESALKPIIIATYSMASEGLDIKTLTTLIMATPKTDIEQSVGRILREKHSNPIVVDIIDAHEPFRNQWKKRKTFYRKEGYKILYTKSKDYQPDTSKWEVKGNVKEEAEAEAETADPILRGKCMMKL
jgi:superfamily II DNA or RNA helicase